MAVLQGHSGTFKTRRWVDGWWQEEREVESRAAGRRYLRELGRGESAQVCFWPDKSINAGFFVYSMLVTDSLSPSGKVRKEIG